MFTKLADSMLRLSSWLRPRHWLVLAIGFALAAALTMGQLQALDAALAGGSGPERIVGIVSLELAAAATAAAAIVSQWSAQGLLDTTRASVELDLWLILSYTGMLVSAFFYFSRLAGGYKQRSLAVLAVLPLLAGGLDLAEDVGLGVMLDDAGSIAPMLSWGTAILATVKFLLLLISANIIVALAIFALFARSTRTLAMVDESDTLKSLKQVLAAEALYRRSRREKAGVALTKPVVGLASSGGGIRSATVNLGVLQVLLDHNLLKQVDYHCTVSGGGYMGTALASLLSFRRQRDDEEKPPTKKKQYRFADGDSPCFDVARRSRLPLPVCDDHVDADQPSRVTRAEVLSHLRAFGDFLVRRRRLLSRDVLRAAGVVVGGMIATMGLFLLVAGVLAMGLLLLGDLASTIPSGVDCLPLWLGSEATKAGCMLHPLPLKQALLAQLGSGPVAVMLAGVLIGAMTMLVTGLLVGRLPRAWLWRDGNTPAETREYRSLWVFGLMVTSFAFVLPREVSAMFGGSSGALSPMMFLLGVMVAGAMAYAIQALASYHLVERLFSMELWRAVRSFTGSVFGLSLLLVLAAGVVGGLPELTARITALGAGKLWHGLSSTEISGAAGALSALLAGVMAWKKQLHGAEQAASRDRVGPLALRLLKMGGVIQHLLLALAVAAFLLVVVLVISVTVPFVNEWIVGALRWLGWRHAGGSTYLPGLVLGAGLIYLLGHRAMDFNRLSLHYFYRDRLAEAYMRTAGPDSGPNPGLRVKRDNTEMRLWELHGIARVSDQQQQPDDIRVEAVDQRLSWWQRALASRQTPVTERWLEGAATSAPYLIYSTCLNLSTERDMSHRTRKSDIFTFSKLYCGSVTTGFVSSAYYRSGRTKAAAVMTVSGAAADSAMGRETFFAQSFAATLFNVRLGQWMENPLYKRGAWAYRVENGVFWPLYLLFEALGMSDCRHRLIHLSDGGHTGDNLGLMPLLQRRCQLIIAVDAEQDHDYGFGSFLNAVNYARQDLNVLIDMDLDRVRADADTGLCSDPFVCGRIDYRDSSNRSQQQGLLVLIKSAVTADMSASLRRYRDRYPDFPHDTTADQFFTEDQFEAYRSLGQQTARMMAEAMPGLREDMLDCELVWEQYRQWLAMR